MPVETPAPSFVSFDDLLNPKDITFKGNIGTDDKCTYGDTSNPVNYRVCLPAN